MNNIFMRFIGGAAKVLTLSYDDNTVYDEKLVQILNKYGIKATFNINSGIFRAESERDGAGLNGDRLTLSDAKRIYIGSGHELAAHTYTHPNIASLRQCDILNEILADKMTIEREFGCIVRGCASPFGDWSEKFGEVLKTVGIVYQRGVEESPRMNLPENWYRIVPTCHHNNPKLMTYAKEFMQWKKTPSGKCRMFYLWGHSHEFNKDNNWNVIEEFASAIGGRDDIWYATNIEVYDYMKAFENLQSNLDNSVIYNPSALTVWFEVNGETMSIRSGEIVKL